MKSHIAIFLSIVAFALLATTWLLRDRLGIFVEAEHHDSVYPRMPDGSIPSDEIQETFRAANERFSAEKNWKKRELDSHDYPFSADDFMEYFEEISPDGVLVITCSFRVGDGQIVSVQYPERLSDAIDLALRVMKNRANNQPNKAEMATPRKPSD